MLKIETFSTRPQSVQAVRVTHENITEVAAWIGSVVTEMSPGRFQIPMPPEDTDFAVVGEWVVKTVDGYSSEEDIDGTLNPQWFTRTTE